MHNARYSMYWEGGGALIHTVISPQFQYSTREKISLFLVVTRTSSYGFKAIFDSTAQT